ncbi:MAG: pantetheine-phosphate adenylyltransferase [Muribaculaceae bacterium]|nr:pantetheine-phosphate adenylyltransferase [Muribaculaceae bacterium]
MTPKYKTALFAGTFNPFTTGHKSIADRALKLADRLVIGFGVNISKSDPGAISRIARVKELYADNPAVTVVQYSGLTTDFARECGADFMVRGVRSVADFEYERNLADVNLKLSGIETILLPALPELSYVSGSMVRELIAHGADASPYLP